MIKRNWLQNDMHMKQNEGPLRDCVKLSLTMLLDN